MFKFYKKLTRKFTHWLTYDPPPQEVPPCDFNRLKYEIRPADVLLIEGRSQVSNVIRRVTQSPWTHAALYLGRLHDIEDPELRAIAEKHFNKTTNARLIIEGLLGKGTIITSLAHYKHHHIRICRPIGLAPADAQLVTSYAIRSLGQGYNVRHLIDLARFILPWSLLPRRWGSTVFRTPSGQPESGICSSLIAEAFGVVKFPILPFITESPSSGVQLIPRNPYLYTPKDFDYSPYFEIIKYPLFGPGEELPYYRRLPWTNDGSLSQDNGELIPPRPRKKKKQTVDNTIHNDSFPTDKDLFKSD